jgi:hypothetical protein
VHFDGASPACHWDLSFTCSRCMQAQQPAQTSSMAAEQEVSRLKREVLQQLVNDTSTVQPRLRGQEQQLQHLRRHLQSLHGVARKGTESGEEGGMRRGWELTRDTTHPQMLTR